MLVTEGVNWCRKFRREVDYQLVKLERPPCIEEHNGCGNCPECKYKLSYQVKHPVIENSEVD